MILTAIGGFSSFVGDTPLLHRFLFHIDARSSLLIQLVRELVADIPNAEIAPFAMNTIWGTSQLYNMCVATEVLDV